MTSHQSFMKKVVTDFVRNHIIGQFRVPETIITGNGANLNNDLIKTTCEKFKIKHKNSTTYRPQIIGSVEVANKKIKRIL